MDNYEKNLFLQAVELHDKTNELLHRIVGYIDAKADLKPALHFVDGPTILTFPTKKSDVGTSEEVEQGFVEFTEKELKQMPKKIQRLIIINKKRCRLETRKSGKNTTTYQIRFRSDGYNVSACGKTIELAKANFIEKLKTAKPKETTLENIIPKTFSAFTVYYFEKFRKPRLTERTYKNDSHRYKKWLQPHFGEKPLDKITPYDCKRLLDEIQADGKSKTADEIYSLMSVIFKGAIAHGIIQLNPLNVVLHIKHETKSGHALTKEEETVLLESLTEWDFKVAVAIALYTGLRPNELETAVIDGPFIKAVNSKRKTRKVEYKKIPIIDKLKPYIEQGIPTLPSPQLIRRRINAIFPHHKLYDLRTTFYTRCKELNVSEHALKEFAGHSLGALGNAYTDLSDEYLLSEGKKLNEW